MKTISFNNDWLCNGKAVTLPHDAQVLETPAADASDGGHGYYPGGVYTYEKTFTAPNEWAGRTVLVEFEGVYKNATVSLNGKELCFHAYGYTGFFVELEGLNIASDNTLTVVADNSKLPNSRWYSGSGIYRPVWVHICEKDGLRPESVKINTVSIDPAIIRVQSSVAVTVNVDGVTGQGTDFTMTIPNAKLWSADEPNLYTARVTAGEGDAMEVTFGIRKIEWSTKGFFINGKETLLRGGCIHHDNGILGAATYAESEERRVRILKENGFNAIRSAHNPTSKALLDACDRMGMYVMDETFDMWYSHKTAHDYSLDWETCWQADVTAMIQKDYNHPSVVMYSVGNEVTEPFDQKGIGAGQAQIALCHKLDSSRPVTAGINLLILAQAAGGNNIFQNKEQDGSQLEKLAPQTDNASLEFNMMAAQIGTGMNNAANSDEVDALVSPILDSLDIAGYNYASGRYPLEEKAHPDRVVVGSETFPQDIWKNWQMVKQYPYLIGDFMWTGWDYLGEVGIGAWSYTGGMPFNRPYPWRLAGAGVIDILGVPDGSCKYASTVWGLEKTPVIAVRPVNHPGVEPTQSVWRGTNAILSWGWANCEGNDARVEVYSDQATVELFLNGESLGKKAVEACQAMFDVKYAPGTLTAVAYDDAGKETGRSELSSAQGEARAVIRPEKESIRPGEILYVPINMEGTNGVVESNADQKLTVTVEGGQLLAFGSANPCTEEQYHTGSFTTYYGRALAIIRAGEAGEIAVTVKDGGASTTKAIQIK